MLPVSCRCVARFMGWGNLPIHHWRLSSGSHSRRGRSHVVRRLRSGPLAARDWAGLLRPVRGRQGDRVHEPDAMFVARLRPSVRVCVEADCVRAALQARRAPLATRCPSSEVRRLCHACVPFADDVVSPPPTLTETSCFACQDGTYQDHPGQTACAACPKGRFTFGGLAYTVCADCDIGAP